jgi:hypothetical protein
MFLGGVIGFVVYTMSVIAALVRMAANPWVAAHVSVESMTAMLLYSVLFIAVGVLSGWLSLLRVRGARYLLIGGMIGALVLSYLSATWPLTSKGIGFPPPSVTVIDTAAIGAGLGIMGGLLLGLLDWLRGIRRSHA